jgi:hypothetical protein
MTTQNNNNFIHYLFYNRIEPERLHAAGSPREHEGLVFDGIMFTGNECPLGDNVRKVVEHKPDVLYVNTFACAIPINVREVAVIRHPDQSGAFRLLETTKHTPGDE